ncbi:MAG: hypothetical protein M3033_16150 [Acidobacteriota bacterium]|nr:hypothetical protein [Acidobacteriota bacterium]
MRLPLKSKIIGGAAILISFVFVYQILNIKKSAGNALAETRARLLEQTSVPFDKRILTPHSSDKIQILQNTNETRDLVRFRDSYFAATSGGLVQYTEDGRLTKHFTSIDGLPTSDLICLSVWHNHLFIGTRSKNLIAFDGEKFEQFNWTDRQTQAITALSEKDGKLLIGTFAGGLLEYDGTNFTEIKADNKKIAAINCLFKTGAKLYVGTFDNGLWIYENDFWTHLTTAENLPSNRVVGIIAKNAEIYVATDFGLSILENKSLRTLAVLPALSGLALYKNQIFLTKDNGEIFSFDASLKEIRALENQQNSRLVSANDALWFLSNQGIFKITSGKIKAFNQPEADAPTDNFVSALAIDKNENLWVGTFRHGIDVFSEDGKKLKHLESEHLREINFLQSMDETVSAATSSGRHTFKKDFSLKNQTKKDGLPSDSITHFSGDFTATTRGLAFQENGKIRVLSTVQGLPNNAVYTTLQTGGKMYAGTLGGLAEIEGTRVVRTFKDSNSNLHTNWITALARADDRIFIGTYGGGVFELLSSGDIRAFENEIGKFVVNPNAMFSDGARLYIGTLAGVKILDLKTQEWKTIRQILPSETVMSIAGNGRNIYFGTANGIARIEKSYFENGESE